MIEKFMTEPHLRLKIMRELFELNRFCFASLLGVKYRTYNTWEKHNIRPNTVAEIKMIKLGLNPNYLRGDNNMFLRGYSYDKVKRKIEKLIKRDT